MTDESNMNQQNTVESTPGQDMMGNSPAEDSQAVNHTPIDFSAASEISNGNGSGNGGSENIGMLMDVNLQFTVELGRTQMPVRQILELQAGSVVELDRIAGDAVDVYINEHLMARGEVVVVDDKFGVRITELISPTKGK